VAGRGCDRSRPPPMSFQRVMESVATVAGVAERGIVVHGGTRRRWNCSAMLGCTYCDRDMDWRHGNRGSTDRQDRIVCPRQRNRACLADDGGCTPRLLGRARKEFGPARGAEAATRRCPLLEPAGPARAEGDTGKRAYGSMARRDMSLVGEQGRPITQRRRWSHSTIIH
jgi:hypothetical protein